MNQARMLDLIIKVEKIGMKILRQAQMIMRITQHRLAIQQSNFKLV